MIPAPGASRDHGGRGFGLLLNHEAVRRDAHILKRLYQNNREERKGDRAENRDNHEQDHAVTSMRGTYIRGTQTASAATRAPTDHVLPAVTSSNFRKR